MEREDIRRAFNNIIESNLLFYVMLMISVFGIDFLNELYKKGVKTEMERLIEGGEGMVGTTTGLMLRDFLGRLVVIGNPTLLPPTVEHRQDVIKYAMEKIKQSTPNWLDKLLIRGFPRGTFADEFFSSFIIQIVFLLLYIILDNWEEVKDYLRRINNRDLDGEGKPEFVKRISSKYK